MNFLRKFNENFKSQSELVEMLENINDIIDPYKDEAFVRDIMLGLMNPKDIDSFIRISSNINPSIFYRPFFTHNYHREVIVFINFYIIKDAPVIQYSELYSIQKEINRRLDLEYPDVFRIKYSQIVSTPIKYH